MNERMFAGQLTIWHELNRHSDHDGLRRIGDGPELGTVLLQPLLLTGWELHTVRPFGEPGWLFILTNGVFEVKRTGADLGDVATELFKEAAAFQGAAAA